MDFSDPWRPLWKTCNEKDTFDSTFAHGKKNTLQCSRAILWDIMLDQLDYLRSCCADIVSVPN
jgi:hypothetical protein